MAFADKTSTFQNESWCTTFHMEMSLICKTTCRLYSFSYERLCTRTRFETKAKANSEMAHCHRLGEKSREKLSRQDKSQGIYHLVKIILHFLHSMSGLSVFKAYLLLSIWSEKLFACQWRVKERSGSSCFLPRNYWLHSHFEWIPFTCISCWWEIQHRNSTLVFHASCGTLHLNICTQYGKMSHNCSLEYWRVRKANQCHKQIKSVKPDNFRFLDL